MAKINQLLVITSLIVLASSQCPADDLKFDPASKFELKFRPSPGQQKTIPFQMRAGYPFIDVDINGLTHNLLFDMTDYRQITLASSVLAETPHRILGTEKYSGADEKVFFLKRFVLEKVGLGQLIKTDVNGTEEAIDPDYPTPSPSGAIGAGMFFDDVLTLDFKNSRLLVDPNGKLDQCEPLAALGLPLVALVTIGGNKLTFFLDIAYQYSIIDADFVEAERQKLPPDKIQSGFYDIAEMKFGHFTLENLRFIPLPMADSGIHGVIGMDVFRRYNLAIDFNNNCFSIPQAKTN